MTTKPRAASAALVARDANALAIRPTILGASATRIPVGGRIRAGIMVLRRSVAEIPQARAIYAAGVQAGKCFDDIESEICAALPRVTNPLAPKNVPYFTVRGSDFPNAGIAKVIMDKYAEDRGDGPRLYRFPVVFPADAWQSVMPHELVAWTASGKSYWSEYSDDGTTRYCKTYAPVPTNNGRRALRTFGGRKVVPRTENDGLCDPERCPQYQDRKCNLSGRFIFYIPGVPSLGAFELPTNSFYAMQHAIERFKTIAFMRGGRISGFLDGRQSTFFLTKRRVEVSRIGDDGMPVRVEQWLIELEAPIDVTALLRPEDEAEQQDVQRRAAEAVVVLEGQVTQMVDGGTSPVAGRATAEVRGSDQASTSTAAGPGLGRDGQRAATTAAKPAGVVVIDADVTTQRGPVQAGGAAARAGENAGVNAPGVAAAKDLQWIYDCIAAMNVQRTQFDQYAEKVWGKGWATSSAGRQRAIAEVNGFADDPDGYRVKLHSELNVFS